MSVDDLGPVRMPESGFDTAPSMPAIPIKPNPAIPVVVGLLLMLGGLMLGFSAYSNLFGGSEAAETQAAETAESINSAGGDLSEQDVIDYFEALDAAGYYTTLGIIESLACVTLLCGGVMLLRRMRIGIRVGIAGGALVAVDAIVGLVLLNGIEPPDPFLAISMKILSAVYVVCGLLCMALPLMPLLISSGRAALLPSTIEKGVND